MRKYQFTPQAAGDLIEIWNFIAKDNPEAADRVEETLFRACDLLADAPFAGRPRKDLTSLLLRFWVVHPYSNYLIVYDPEKKPLQSIRILLLDRTRIAAVKRSTPSCQNRACWGSRRCTTQNPGEGNLKSIFPLS
jgi:plasmid stabilization system protein ParE